MTRRIHVAALLLAGALAALQQSAQAGEAYFYSQITYDPNAGTVYGYSETYYDYSSAYYYYGCTVSYLGYDSTTVDWGQICAEGATTEVWTYSPTAIPGKTYYVVANHIVEAEYLYSDVYMPCYANCGSYYDAFGFSWLPAPPSGQSEHWISSTGPETPLAVRDARLEQTATPIYISKCGDPGKDQLVGEYVDPYYQAPTAVTCDELTQNSGSSHFSFGQMNSGWYSWGIIEGVLSTGVDCVWDHVSGYSLDVSSGYRNPAKNFQTENASPTSPHMYGRAVDFHSTSANHWTAISNAGKDYCSACREPGTTNWVHLDFGRSCPSGW